MSCFFAKISLSAFDRQGNFHPVILFKVFVIDRPVATDELGAHTGCQNHGLADAVGYAGDMTRQSFWFNKGYLEHILGL